MGKTGVLHTYVVVKGKPIIKGTRIAVSVIATYYKMGLSPEEIQRELPHINLAQIHDALSYYYDHQNEIDEEIENELESKLR